MNQTSQNLYIPDEAAMLALGTRLSHVLQAGNTVFLQGQLGSGKTTLVRGILQGLGFHDYVKSPTYTLVESYALKNLEVNHFDLYRIEHPSNLEEIGIRDYFQDQAVCIFEWPERVLDLLPEPDIHCAIDCTDDARLININSTFILNV